MTIRFGSVRGPTSMGVKRSLLVLAGRSCIDNSPLSRGCERHDTSYCGDAASQGEIDELLWNIKTVIQKTSLSEDRDPRKSTVPRWSWGALDNGRRELRRGPLARTTSRCVPTSFLPRLGWLAQFSQTLAIAPSALGSAHRLAAERRTPFSPRAHYKLSIWCWAPRYSRWPRPHKLGELHDFMPA